ncbi:gluconolactonase [Acetobacter sp. TBRC 12305]|uniref:Gluconolactonase n=2 Tax=Acetobacter garciniae TaxID=2817435 RepID=A0A939KRQ7_9PROT|nr:L-dopachrome tautomerase-related protein [Acetobacter garciniae]MBO1325886.1 gluconolactonase [Acetobacter garciniae]MBX0345786.1 gluconolactonase [Acetobacter garciniae]
MVGLLANPLAGPLASTTAWALHMPKVAELGPSALTPFMQSDKQVWDAILPLPDGRMLFEAPAWVGNTGPQLYARAPDGTLAPWPDAAWNATQGDAATRIVSAGGLVRAASGSVWVLDNGVPDHAKPPVAPPKLLEIDPAQNKVLRSIPIEASALRPGSILSGVAVHDKTAYVADSGVGAVIVVDLAAGMSRRFLDHHPALVATRPIVTPAGPLHDASGRLAALDASMIAVSPDGSWIVVQPPSGYLSRIATSLFFDPDVTPAAFEEGVTQWFKTPTLGGMAIDSDGTLYWADVTTGSILSYTTGRIPRRLITDPRLTWPTTPGLDEHGHLFVSASQIDHTTAFGGAQSVTWPVTVYEMTLPTTPPPQ